MAHVVEGTSGSELCNWRVMVDGCPSPVSVTDARLQENDREMLTLTGENGKVVFRTAWGRVQYIRRYDPKLADGVALALPPEMAHEGYNWIARLGAGFAEVLPGLEAAIFWPPDDGGKIVAHFRLTPKEGAGMADLNAKAGAFAKEHGSFSLHFDAARNYLRPDDAPWSLELHGRETEWGGLTAEEALDFAAAELGAAP